MLRLAREIGLEESYALKEMADRVVPDLGVLKLYPPAWVDERRLEFVMGMSANERYGALSNWLRLGFERLQRDTTPEVWVATVVNNRADRVPRSRVFASLLANEFSADAHLLIGNNLSGLMGYIREAWEARLSQWSLDDGHGSVEQARERWRAMAQWLRLPLDQEQVLSRVQAMLNGLALDLGEPSAAWLIPEQLDARLEALGTARRGEVLAALRRDLDALAAYREIDQALHEGADLTALSARAAQLGWRLFSAKLIVLKDYYATGDRVVQELADHQGNRMNDDVVVI